MDRGRIISLFALLWAMSAVGSAQEVVSQAVIRGTASYRERMAIPPEAVFEAAIVDVSQGVAPPDVLGRVRLESPGQPPIRFEIPYDASSIQEGHRYVVRASITVGDRPWFTTDRLYPVLTGGSSDTVDLLLTRASASAPAGEIPGVAALGSLPASFEGDLPSASGPGIHDHLDLFPNRVFVLRMNALGPGNNPPLDQIGTWVLSADGGRLMLKGAGRPPILFSIQDGTVLHMLDQEGREIEPHLRYSLTRLESFAPVEPRLFLRGMYRSTAEGGVFQECRTGWRLPVVGEGDYAALESAYSNARHESGEPLFVTLRGRIVHRPHVDGAGGQMALVPERFIGVWPGETCGLPHSGN